MWDRSERWTCILPNGQQRAAPPLYSVCEGNTFWWLYGASYYLNVFLNTTWCLFNDLWSDLDPKAQTQHAGVQQDFRIMIIWPELMIIEHDWDLVVLLCNCSFCPPPCSLSLGVVRVPKKKTTLKTKTINSYWSFLHFLFSIIIENANLMKVVLKDDELEVMGVIWWGSHAVLWSKLLLLDGSCWPSAVPPSSRSNLSLSFYGAYHCKGQGTWFHNQHWNSVLCRVLFLTCSCCGIKVDQQTMAEKKLHLLFASVSAAVCDVCLKSGLWASVSARVWSIFSLSVSERPFKAEIKFTSF